jgi:3-oxoacyl-[acyl-carrier protein] reductase
MSDLRGKVALVTGGAGGIGSGICEVLAENGASVIVGYNSSQDAAAALVKKLANADANHTSLAVRVTDTPALAALAKDIESKFGRLDILVNCHGMTKFVDAKDLDALDDALIDRILATNVRGTFATVRALRTLLARNGDGLVVNISSIAPKIGVGSNMMYVASKGAVDTLTHSLALALAPEVRVASVSPGFVATEAATKNFDQSIRDNHMSRTPLKRFTTPRDIGDAIIALTRMTAVTGVIIPVDTGRSLS